MYSDISNEFIEKLSEDSRTFRAQVEFIGIGSLESLTLESEVVDFEVSYDSGGEKVTIGNTLCAQCSLTVYNLDDIHLEDRQLENREFRLGLGIQLDDGSFEYVPMGRYVVKDISVTSNFEYKITAYDKMLNTEKRYLTELMFPNTATNVIKDICDKTGIFYPTELYNNVAIRYLPKGCTMREMIGYIASLLGCFAFIDRAGKMRFKWYSEPDDSILSRNVTDEPTVSLNPYTIQYVECSVNDKKLLSGDENGTMGISFENPLMTQELLDKIFNGGLYTTYNIEYVGLKGFSYYAVDVEQILGDPRNDVYDMRKAIVVEEEGGTTGWQALFPLMSLSFDFDGGLSCKMSASIPTEDKEYETPYEREQSSASETVEEATLVMYGINTTPIRILGNNKYTEVMHCNVSVYDDSLPYAIATIPYYVDTALSIDINASLQIDKNNYWHFVKSESSGNGIFNISAPIIGLSSGSHSVGVALSFSSDNDSSLSIEQGTANIIVTGNGLSGAITWDGLITESESVNYISVSTDTDIVVKSISENASVLFTPVYRINNAQSARTTKLLADDNVSIVSVTDSVGMPCDIVSAIIKNATTIEITFTNPIQAIDLSKISVSSVLDSSCVFTVDIDPEKSYASNTVLTIVAINETCDFTTDTYILVSATEGALEESLTGKALIFDKVINGGSNQ